jgi:hypothetical protein
MAEGSIARALDPLPTNYSLLPVLIRCLVVFLFGGNPRHKNAAVLTETHAEGTSA